jgi:hypothetical protein
LISLPRQVVSQGHPVFFWIPASAGMTTLRHLTAGLVMFLLPYVTTNRLNFITNPVGTKQGLV